MTNNKNPYALDQDNVRAASWDHDVVRAEVLDVLPKSHAVRVQPRGEAIPIIAPVLTLTNGSLTLPEKGQRVVLLYVTDNTPVALGGMYLGDGKSPPDAQEGDLILGNSTGSTMKIHEDGHITISTAGTPPIDVDHQSASVYLGTDFSAPSGGVYTKVPFDTTEDDQENLFRPSTNDIKVKADGLHRITTSVEIPTAGQNNSYSLAIFINGIEQKRVSQQSSVNAPLSIQLTTMKRLDKEDVIDVRIQNNSGTNRTVLGSSTTTEFDVRRAGI